MTVEWPLKKPVNSKEDGDAYASCSEDEWLDTWGETIVPHAYRREKGWVDEKMTREYCERKLSSVDSGNAFGCTTAGLGLFSGYVNEREELVISRDGHVGPAVWGMCELH